MKGSSGASSTKCDTRQVHPHSQALVGVMMETRHPANMGKTIDGITYRKANPYYANDDFVEKAKCSS